MASDLNITLFFSATLKHKLAAMDHVVRAFALQITFVEVGISDFLTTQSTIIIVDIVLNNDVLEYIHWRQKDQSKLLSNKEFIWPLFPIHRRVSRSLQFP